MFDLKINRPISCQELLKGLDMIAKATASVYGGGNIMCARKDGGIVVSDKLKDIIINGYFDNPNAEFARQLLAEQTLIEDGLKTAVLIANECIQTASQIGLDESEFLIGMSYFARIAIEKLQEISKTNGTDLPGGGLYLINICRPLLREFENGKHPVCLNFVRALEKPFLILAENAGREPREAFACMKAAAPTQFYSLRHFGLEGSIPISEHRDLFRMGIDLHTGKIVDLMSKGITLPINTAIEVLETTKAIAANVCSVRCVI